MVKRLILKANRSVRGVKPGSDSLFYLTLWTRGGCNQGCVYCATKGWEQDVAPLSLKETVDVINQAKALHVKEVNINGSGEPLLWQETKDLVRYIRSSGIACRITTNGTLITPEVARWLYDNQVSLVVKLHSVADPAKHDELVGKAGSYDLVRRGLDNLLAVGYPAVDEDDHYRYTQLGIMTLLAKPCYADIEGVLSFCAQNAFYPMLDDIVVAGSMTRELFLRWGLSDSESAKVIGDSFQRIMGYPLTTDVADVCAIDVGGVFIGRNGEYYADREGSCCDALATTGFGDIRTKKLAEIWNELLSLREKHRVYCNPEFTERRSCASCCYGMWKSQGKAESRS